MEGSSKNHSPEKLVEIDPWVAPYLGGLQQRIDRKIQFLSQLGADGLLGEISRGHFYFGFTRGVQDGQQGTWYREWAPGATHLSVVGDFNGWNPFTHPLSRDGWGVWSIFLPDSDLGPAIPHQSLVKVRVSSESGHMDRIPAYIRRVVQDPSTHAFSGQMWSEPNEHIWQHSSLSLKENLRVYEAHIGMAQEEGKVGSFTEFKEKILPRIVRLGYNAIQLMGIMEHPYYGSFGYHVSNFFAVSSRFGTPEELKALIDEAHSHGILVIMDLVHSHAVKNTLEGLNGFDGTDHQYFHAGARGDHPAWDSLCFDYSKYEVLRFLLSNVRFWLEEFRFDGFRFDGVTSMLYFDHGLGRNFVSYDDYFSENVDLDSVAYLSLANELAHLIKPDAITIAEDVSGMVGIARPTEEGGLGFNYRLSMGIPDFWIKLLKESRDEDWPLGHIYGELVNRRPEEKHVAYSESHDQALVGDKTIAMWLLDQKIYNDMSKFQQDLVVSRGVALHKMIRLLTFSVGGEGYLNFMGNEFGHPEWIDFPRAENNFSYHYARRQWSLADTEHLYFHSLEIFDREMIALDRNFNSLSGTPTQQLAVHEDTRQLVFSRGQLVFLFNFHGEQSFSDLRIPVPEATDYEIILNTDSPQFGGHGLVDEHQHYPWLNQPMYGQKQSILVYLPARSALVLAPRIPK